MAGFYNRLVAAPGEALKLGTQGGRLLLNPPSQAAGQMNLYMMQSRVLHLLREPGPYTGGAIPSTGDYAGVNIQTDLNIMLGQFVSATGLAPMISEKMITVPVFPVLDYPVPPDLQSLTRVEYTPSGKQTYTLDSKSLEEFDAYWADDTLSMGQPYVYREMFAGYIRLFPQPSVGNAYGPGTGMVTFNGTPGAGQTVATVITNNPNPSVVIPTYVVQAGDTLSSIAQNVANLIAASDACIGPTPFLQPPSISGNAYQLTGLNPPSEFYQLADPPGSNISYLTTITGSGLTVTPNGSVYLQPNGDTMNFYYTSTGTIMVYAGDCPGIPPQFHMALVYGVLADYWLRKADPEGQADRYFKRFGLAVTQAKNLEWDAKRDVQPTLAGYYDTDLDFGWSSY